MVGTSVSGYVIHDKITGQRFSMEKGVVEQLALNKQIYNCHAQVYNNIVNMKGIGCKLSSLPRYDSGCNKIVKKKDTPIKKADYEIVGKIQKGRKVLGYILIKLDDTDKTRYNMEKSQVLKLARAGKIINAKCQMYGSEPMLRAAPGCDLTKIEIYSVT
jgi:hypothetical protein